MIKDLFLTRKYYLDSLSLFMKSSDSMIARMDTYFGQLQNIVKVQNDIMNFINIFSVDEEGTPNYFELNNILKSGLDSYMLDIIGSIYGIKRQQRIKYRIPTTDTIISKLLDEPINTDIIETITLQNYEMLICIQMAIVENNYDGTYESLQTLYRYGFMDDLGTVTKIYCAEDLNLRYEFSTPDSPLTCTTRLTTAPSLIANGYINLVKLFYGGYLTINSLGITYTRTAFNKTFPGIFTNINDYGTYVDSVGCKFYNPLYEEYPIIDVTISSTTYTYVLQQPAYIILSIIKNGTELARNQFSFNETTQTITFITQLQVDDTLKIQVMHCQSYNNTTGVVAGASTLQLTGFQTSTISAVRLNTIFLTSSQYSFNDDSQILTLNGITFAATDTIDIFCEPIEPIMS